MRLRQIEVTCIGNRVSAEELGDVLDKNRIKAIARRRDDLLKY